MALWMLISRILSETSRHVWSLWRTPIRKRLEVSTWVLRVVVGGKNMSWQCLFSHSSLSVTPTQAAAQATPNVHNWMCSPNLDSGRSNERYMSDRSTGRAWTTGEGDGGVPSGLASSLHDVKKRLGVVPEGGGTRPSVMRVQFPPTNERIMLAPTPQQDLVAPMNVPRPAEPPRESIDKLHIANKSRRPSHREIT